MGENGRRRVQQLFSLSHFADRLDSIASALVKEKKKKASRPLAYLFFVILAPLTLGLAAVFFLLRQIKLIK